MKPMNYYLAQLRTTGKWHIISTSTNKVIAECDTLPQATEKLSELLGDDDWNVLTLKDETNGEAQAMLEKRKQPVH